MKVWETLGAGVSRGRLEELWRHAVAVAMATKALATRLRAGDPEEAFTAALTDWPQFGQNWTPAPTWAPQWWQNMCGYYHFPATAARNSTAVLLQHRG